MTSALSSLFEGLTLGTIATSAIDIALVAFLIYRLLMAIRGTRAAEIVVGIVLIAAAFFVAQRLELTTVSWLLDNVISYIFIFIIIVFQQDIRRGLGRIGQNILPFARGHDSTGMVDEIVGAVAKLARARVGAIVVLARDADLEEFVEDATRLDAVLGRQLLISLFLPAPDNELHDGAVVVSKERRIELARALLPLSKSSDLGPEFGTRHRAALGITEDTDAVAVVVSEERGEISLCFKGSIARGLEPLELRRALHGLLGVDSEDMADEAEAAAEVGKAVASLGLADISGIRNATSTGSGGSGGSSSSGVSTGSGGSRGVTTSSGGTGAGSGGTGAGSAGTGADRGAGSAGSGATTGSGSAGTGATTGAAGTGATTGAAGSGAGSAGTGSVASGKEP